MLLFVIFGGLIGLAVGGLGGLLLGAVLGYGVGFWMLRVLLARGLGLIQRQFLDSTFAFMDALCKADGHVTENEIRVAEQFFDRLALSAEQCAVARNSFNRGKSEDFDLDAETARQLGVGTSELPSTEKLPIDA